MLSLHNVSHAVAGRDLFTELSLSVDITKRYGLVGPNGVGKTTLARILAGQILPTEGTVSKQVDVAYLPQEVAGLLYGQDTVGEMLASLWDFNAGEIFQLSQLIPEIDPDRPLSSLSGGERMRVRLASLLGQKERFLILDEPSNNLDRSGRQFLSQFLSTYTGGVLIISHDRELLESVDAIYELSNQGISLYGGNFDFYWSARERERRHDADLLDEGKRERAQALRRTVEERERLARRARHGKLRAERFDTPARERKGMKRTAQHTAGRMMKMVDGMAASASAAVDASWGALKTDPFIRLDFPHDYVPSTKIVMRARNLSWRFQKEDAPLWDKPLNLEVRGPERVRIAGPNGAGKSTLLKLILNKASLPPGVCTGELVVGVQNVAYLDQSYGTLDPNLSVLENLQSATRYSLVDLRNELAFYGFTERNIMQPVIKLSGGEQLKASLAQMFLGEHLPELIILDEPTNNLDIMSTMLLERALDRFAGALIVVSHDERFVQKLRIERTLNIASTGICENYI